VHHNIYAAGSGFTTANVDIPGSGLERWRSDPTRHHRCSRDRIRREWRDSPGARLECPLVLGSYDIVIDANQNGDYDAATDGLDSGSPGFVVIDMPSVPVPALARQESSP